MANRSDKTGADFIEKNVAWVNKRQIKMAAFPRIELLLLLAVCGIFVFLCLIVFPFMLDDPFITFRYAENWANGDGIVWNQNEYVEGYSNFSFLVLLAPFAWLNCDLYYVSKILSMLFGLGAIVLTYRFSKRHLEYQSIFFYFIAPLLLATSAHFSLWSVGGLETTLFGFLLLLLCFVLLSLAGWRRHILLALILFFLSITRPEGPMFVAVAFTVVLVNIEKMKLREWSSLFWLPLYSLLYGGYLLWRLFYYGDFVPNTYYVKITGGTDRIIAGVKYLIAFFNSHGSLFWVFAILAVGVVLVKRTNVLFLLSLCFSALVAFSIYSGGDWMPGFRFLVPVLPLFFLLIQETTSWLWELMANSKNGKLILGLFFMVLLPTIYVNSVQANITRTPWLKQRFFAGMSEKRDRPQYQVVDYLQRNAKDGDLVAVQEAGIIPYETMHLSYVDIWGLNDKHIARKTKNLLHWDKGDADYVLSRQPDWLALWVLVKPDGEIRAAQPAVTAILSHPTFVENYKLVKRYPTPKAGQPWWQDMVFFIYRNLTKPQVPHTEKH